MSAQRTNTALVFVAILIAVAIVVYAIMSRQSQTGTSEMQITTPPAVSEPAVEKPTESGGGDGVTHIDQTTDTTHAPVREETSATTEAVITEAEARPEEQKSVDTPITSLVDAASRGDAEVVSAMILAGHELDATDEGGRTPLMAAAGGGHVDIVFLLLNAGADPALRDDARRAARDYALARYDESGQIIARILGDAVGPPPVQDAGEK